jgi:uncharacterized protein YukE
MKKLLLAILLIGSTAFAQSPYQGKSLQEFQAEDRELKNALSELKRILRSKGEAYWIKSPVTDTLKCLHSDMGILKGKLHRIDETLKHANKELEKTRNGLAIGYIMAPVVAPIAVPIAFPLLCAMGAVETAWTFGRWGWLITKEIAKYNRQQEIVRQITEAQQTVKGRIQNMYVCLYQNQYITISGELL